MGASGHVVVVSDAAATDMALWHRALRGDERAFVTVYDRYAQRLLTYAYRRTGSSQRAEDVVSLVMLEAWRRRRDVRFGYDETIAGWLFRTARYVLANDARSARRHRQALARIAQLAPPATDELDRHLVDDERLRHALDTLGRLSSRDRDVLELAVWSGLNESEMAAALGIPVGTFKSRLSRARRRLAELCALPRQSLPVVRLATNSEELQ
ncbi:MAG: RNA polymerase sigma factor [Acidimicrobiales bacterium]